MLKFGIKLEKQDFVIIELIIRIFRIDILFVHVTCVERLETFTTSIP